jgi:hypothetical protein
MGENMTSRLFMRSWSRGKLDSRWSHWFADLQIIPQPDGNSLITGPIADQSALYGVISRLRDLGMVLISIQRIIKRGER